MQNPYIVNPAGTSTTPASSAASGLIKSRNPIDSSGNLVITGNVRRGQHFQGPVPYSSRTSFGAPLGSTGLDSFLRDSVNAEDLRYNSGKYTPQPYYSQTGTVTTSTPGQRSVFNPAATRVDSRAMATTGQRTTAQASGENLSLQGQYAQGTKVPDYELRPLRISPSELEKLISDGIAISGRARRVADEEDLAQMQRLQRDLEQLRLRASDLRQSLIVRDESLRPLDKYKSSAEEAIQLSTPQTLQKPTERMPELNLTKPLQEQDEIALRKQIKQQLEKLQEALEQTPIAQKIKEIQEAEGDEEKLTPKKSNYEKYITTISKESALEETHELLRKKFPSLEQDTAKKLSAFPEAEEQTDVSGPAESSISPRAQSVLNEYKTFTAFSEDKFEQHISDAESYLKQGKYYWAVDAYTLASFYKPDDPAAYFGKSHAMFAAGEYISSSLFLSRALKLSPELAWTKVDFVTILGDKEKLDTRITDIEEWLQRSGAADLEFLLGYVYYQTGDLDKAKAAIDSAYQKQPNSPAVSTVKDAIYDAMGIVK